MVTLVFQFIWMHLFPMIGGFVADHSIPTFCHSWATGQVVNGNYTLHEACAFHLGSRT